MPYFLFSLKNQYPIQSMVIDFSGLVSSRVEACLGSKKYIHQEPFPGSLEEHY